MELLYCGSLESLHEAFSLSVGGCSQSNTFRRQSENISKGIRRKKGGIEKQFQNGREQKPIPSRLVVELLSGICDFKTHLKPIRITWCGSSIVWRKRHKSHP